MIEHEISMARDQDLFASIAAMKRAAALARLVAVQTGTAIVVSKNEKIVRRTAAELQAESQHKEGA